MNDHTIEIRDDEINVVTIMEKIRENIRRRQAAGELPPDPDPVNATTSKNYNAGESDDAIQRDLLYINSNWDIHNNSYFISSHHPHIGKFLVKGRQLVHGEVRRYVDPVADKQSRLNKSTVRLLHSLAHEIEKIEETISDLESEMEKKIRDETLQAISIFTTNIERKSWLAHVLEDRLLSLKMNNISTENPSSVTGMNYLSFENRFRGSCNEIRYRQREFLPYFDDCSHVLDIGCGRGEFLEILREHYIGAKGVDLDSDMVNYCRSLHLDVEMEDAIIYLEKLEDQSIDGIFIDQVVEHLEPAYLVQLLSLCHQKLKNGHYIVVETVNPLSFVSFVNFYIDLTHRRPVHPETLQFLMTTAGFRDCEKKFFSPVSDEGRLKKITEISEGDESARKNVEVYNNNIEILNTVLFGAQDYAIIGKK